MREFVLHFIHVVVYAFELLYHKLIKHDTHNDTQNKSEREDKNNECD